MTTKVETGGGVRALVVAPLLEEFFAGFPWNNRMKEIQKNKRRIQKKGRE